MIRAGDAVAAARALKGTPYGELDCINLIKRVIRQAPGGVAGYTTAGTNTLWSSYETSAKYRDLTWRQEGISGARAGMLAFKRAGDDVHHVGLATGEGTVVHSSSVRGEVTETPLTAAEGWNGLAVHRYIEPARTEEGETDMETLYQAVVTTQSTSLNLRDAPDGSKIGSLPRGATVDVLDDSDAKWWRVRYEGQEGYASTAYLVRAACAEAEEIAPDAVAVTEEATTLVRDDGTSIVLIGKWRVVED